MPLVLALVGEVLYQPVLDKVKTLPLLDSKTVQNLVILALNRGDQVLEWKSEVYQLCHLWLRMMSIIKCVKDIHMQGCTVLSQGLQSQGSFVTPVL